tara:strand:- start:85832 stop:86359 length:528 start_codon:yes stop_codon:yes gene_type:complete
MNKSLLLLVIIFFFVSNTTLAQGVRIDGRLKPYLDDFFELCDKYEIDYIDKLVSLKKIAVVENLKTSSEGSILGRLERDENKKVENIVVNWIAMLDAQILKVVAFHEFGHYFLEYDQHVCDDCGIIMSVVNTSYFDIANDWDNQIKILFEQSPAYLKKQNTTVNTVARSYPTNCP